MKYLSSIVLAIILVSCKEPQVDGPRPHPNTCPKCGETRTYEIIDLGKTRNYLINRRCGNCNYVWYCKTCVTKPSFTFW